MKYYRKQPVEAIQWNGDNQNEVYQLASKAVNGCYTADDADSDLHVAYWDARGNKHFALIPKFGWVVIEGKTLQFYKDETFRKTFKPADGNDQIWSSAQEMIDNFEKSFEDMAHTDDVIWRMILKECSPSISETLCNVRDNVEKAFNAKIREEKYKSAWMDSEGNIEYNESTPEQVKLKAMYKEFMDNYKKMLDALIDGGIEADANELRKYTVDEEDADITTFDSVLDEMKELHAKKNKDYKGSFHGLFKEYGMPYALGHLEEKLNRVKAITANGGNAVKNDHIEDSVIDLASYAVMLYVELKNQKK